MICAASVSSPWLVSASQPGPIDRAERQTTGGSQIIRVRCAVVESAAAAQHVSHLPVHNDVQQQPGAGDLQPVDDGILRSRIVTIDVGGIADVDHQQFADAG
jgi:hypothetical protein